jgi:hypothetical protein
VASADITSQPVRQSFLDVKDKFAVGLATSDLADGCVTAAKIADGVVGSTQITDGSVTAVKLASDSVETLKIKDGNVTAAKLATDAVETLKIKDANVTEGKLASSAVAEAKIATGAVTVNKIGSGAVTEAKIGTGAVTETKLGSGAVTNGKIGDDAVSSGKLYRDAASLLEVTGGYFAVVNGDFDPQFDCASDIASPGFIMDDCYANNWNSEACDVAEIVEVHPDYKLSEQQLSEAAIYKANTKVESHLDGVTDPEKIAVFEAKREKKRKLYKDLERFCKMVPGTVTIITDQGIVPVAQKDDTRLKGVISTEPGVTAGSGKAGVPIALRGIVPCWVVGKGNAGDILTTSATEGCAEVTDTPVLGAVVGKLEHDKNSEAKALVDIWVI